MMKRNGHTIISLITIVLSMLMCGDIVLAEVTAPPAEMPWYSAMMAMVLTNFPEINAWFASAMLLAMGLLRSLAEFLNFIAKKTETKIDDQALIIVTNILKWVSSIIGWFGLGKPQKK